MRPTLALLLLSPAPALAHPGHLAGLAGHDHWVAGAALAAALLAGLWGVRAGRTVEAAEPDPTPETEDAA